VRPLLQTALGPRGFTLTHSALSLAAFVRGIGAAGRAPFVTLWDWAAWHVYVPFVTLLPVCLVLTPAISRPNPFSFGGARNADFDPARPSIIRLYRHPLLLALALWAAAYAARIWLHPTVIGVSPCRDRQDAKSSISGLGLANRSRSA
jgi:uncharacterized membrane protein